MAGIWLWIIPHNLLKLANKLADIKANHAKAIIQQVVDTAEYMLSVIVDYPIDKTLIADVQHDVNANVRRMIKV